MTCSRAAAAFGGEDRRHNAEIRRSKPWIWRRLETMKLDRFDRQLLNLVQEDASRTSEDLAQRVALSPSAVQRRLRKLKEAGVIVRHTAVLEPRKVGRPTFFIVSLEIERDRPELLTQLRAWLASEEHVQQAFYVTGEADFILVVTAPDTETYDALMARLATENPNVRKFTTNVALGVVKRGLTIPVSLEED
jgi:Lrp/AsnC family leucine-responsive transcriptional regulator